MMLSWRLHKARVMLGAGLAWFALGLVFTFLLAAVAPFALGLKPYTVRSGSMQPTIDTGDIVVDTTIRPTEAGVGDIVTFKDSQRSGELITHRVRAVRRDGDQLDFVTRGDANNNVERWSVPANGSIGKVVYRVPKLGYALASTGSGPGRIALIAIPALLLCGLGLIRIWAPERLGAKA
jgi:signal peptidase I